MFLTSMQTTVCNKKAEAESERQLVVDMFVI